MARRRATPRCCGLPPRLVLLLLSICIALELLLHRLPALHQLPSLRNPQPATAATLSQGEEAIRSAAMRAAAANDGTVLLTFVSMEQSAEVPNFLALLRSANLLPVLLAVALDDASAAQLLANGVDSHALPAASVRSHPAARWRLMAMLASSGLRVWVCDVQTLWLRGPLHAASAAALPTGCDAAFALGSPPASHALISPSISVRSSDDEASRERTSTSLAVFAAGSVVARWQLRMASLLDEPYSPQQTTRHEGADASSDALARELARCAANRAAHGSVPAPHVARDEDSELEGSSSAGCLSWCTLPPSIFPNALRAFQQPTDDGGAGGADGAPSHGLVSASVTARNYTAILADAVPRGVAFEYRLREAELWHAPGAPSWLPPPRRTTKPDIPQPRTKSTPRTNAAPDAASESERYIAFKELLINNGLSNARNALRSALAIAQVTNRTLILPPLWSRHLRGGPHRVATDYYFDVEALTRHFPRVREAAYLPAAFPAATRWPPERSVPVFFMRLSDDEQLCEEVVDSARLESLGNVRATCPPLTLPPGQLVATTAGGFHLGADEAQLRAWLAPHAHRPLLYFARMFRRFRRFTDARSHDAFLARYAAGVRPAPSAFWKTEQ